jgi:hypothetical protein
MIISSMHSVYHSNAGTSLPFVVLSEAADAVYAASCRQEVMTLQQLRHPHVVQFLGACMKAPNLCLVTEYMPYSLHSVLYEQQGVTMDRKRSVAVRKTDDSAVRRILQYPRSI